MTSALDDRAPINGNVRRRRGASTNGGGGVTPAGPFVTEDTEPDAHCGKDDRSLRESTCVVVPLQFIMSLLLSSGSGAGNAENDCAAWPPSCKSPQPDVVWAKPEVLPACIKTCAKDDCSSFHDLALCGIDLDGVVALDDDSWGEPRLSNLLIGIFARSACRSDELCCNDLDKDATPPVAEPRGVC